MHDTETVTRRRIPSSVPTRKIPTDWNHRPRQASELTVSHLPSSRLLSALLTAASAACGVTPALSAQAPVPRARVVATIDSLAAAFLADGPVAGVSVAVVKGRDTILAKGYGLADIENEVPATTKTVYRIGSITKQFTSAAIMRLVDDGKLSLDDTLGKLLPSA